MPLYAINGSKLKAQRVGDVISFTADSGSDTNLSPPLDPADRDRLMIRIYRMNRRILQHLGLTDENDG